VPIAVALAVALAAGAGAFAQRLSGIGFSLIVAPSLALVTGPRDGIALTNLLVIVVALAVFAASARHVDKAKLPVLVPAGLAGVVPGVIVFRLLPVGPLQVAVGIVTGLGLAAVVAVPRVRARPRLATTMGAGAVSGFTTAVAGAGGPALTVYAVATDWPQPRFAATCQLNYAIQAAAALAVKGLPPLPLAVLATALAAALSGLMAGHLAAARISGARVRHAAIGLAALATLATVIRGLSP